MPKKGVNYYVKGKASFDCYFNKYKLQKLSLFPSCVLSLAVAECTLLGGGKEVAGESAVDL